MTSDLKTVMDKVQHPPLHPATLDPDKDKWKRLDVWQEHIQFAMILVPDIHISLVITWNNFRDPLTTLSSCQQRSLSVVDSFHVFVSNFCIWHQTHTCVLSCRLDFYPSSTFYLHRPTIWDPESHLQPQSERYRCYGKYPGQFLYRISRCHQSLMT